ncbi:MAG: YbaK/EbsC family protein [archaeon]|jgi:prolyl-tRNA editing enzyme YbaK/EbsC (Cys-tRNA(Pro) deacylase)
MDSLEIKLKEFIKHNHIPCEHFHFEQSCHSVKEAANAVNTQPTNLVKNVCLVGEKDKLIIAIVSGEERVSTTRVAKTLKLNSVRTATIEEILKLTGYPAGGVPSFGYNAIFIIDDQVMEKEHVYTGGGSENSLVKISPKEIQKQNNALIARIRK